jgi:ribosomal protein S18 acetylase RimI-like enzyme
MKDFNIKFYFSLDRKSTLKKIFNSDICIISSGIIIYETLSFGKLIYSKPLSENQRPHFNYLLKNKKILKISNLRKLDLSKKIISPDQNIYFSNSEILKIIFFPIKNKFGQSIHLDFFDLSFSKKIYSLQNEYYRKYYRNSETFSYKIHKKYLGSIIKNPKIQLLVIKNKNNFIGYIKVEVKNKKSFVSIAIKKEFQGKNIASLMLEYLVKSNYFIYPPFAEINHNNLPSLFAFKKAGFSTNKNIKIFK